MYYTCMSKTFDQSIHLLLPKEDLQLLKRQAHKEKKSVGELIRQAIRKLYSSTQPHLKKEAFERLAKHDELRMEDWTHVKKDLLRRYE